MTTERKLGYVVYILRTDKDTLYIGLTNDLSSRIRTHASRKGAKYLRPFHTLSLVYAEYLPTKSDALKREYELKQLNKEEKEALVLTFSFSALSDAHPLRGKARRRRRSPTTSDKTDRE